MLDYIIVAIGTIIPASFYLWRSLIKSAKYPIIHQNQLCSHLHSIISNICTEQCGQYPIEIERKLCILSEDNYATEMQLEAAKANINEMKEQLPLTRNRKKVLKIKQSQEESIQE